MSDRHNSSVAIGAHAIRSTCHTHRQQNAATRHCTSPAARPRTSAQMNHHRTHIISRRRLFRVGGPFSLSFTSAVDRPRQRRRAEAAAKLKTMNEIWRPRRVRGDSGDSSPAGRYAAAAQAPKKATTLTPSRGRK